MKTTLLKIPDLTFKQRILSSKFKLSLYLILLAPISVYISFYFNAIGVMVFSIGVFMFGTVSLVTKLYVFVNYIYEIEFDADKEVLIFKNSKRGFGNRIIVHRLKIDNFKLRYFNGYRVYPGFWIEQRQPYLDVLKQYKIGYWKEDNSMELFRQYTTQFGAM